MAEIGQDIVKARRILRAGGLVAIPTETVYGLAGNAFNSEAIASIFRTKKRPSFDPLIVHTSAIDRIACFACEIPQKARQLADRFWPGPLTLLLKKKDNLPELVTSGLETVAVRIPVHPLTKDLLASVDFPIAAPSANLFGYISPTCAGHVAQQLGNKIPYILDGGVCKIGVESTIISFEAPTPKILRLGGLTVAAIEAVIGPVEVAIHSGSRPDAPGMLTNHYAPLKTIVLIEEFKNRYITDFSEIGALMFDHYAENVPKKNQFLMSANGDIAEAAMRFFSGLRMLDQQVHIQTIVTDYVPNRGLGRAINDRIKRATINI